MAPIHDAAYNIDVEALRRLLAEGVSPRATDFMGSTPLHCLCRSTWGALDDRLLCLRLLLDAGANLEAVDCNRHTPLHWCTARHENVEIMKLLVEAGANVNAAADFSKTALHFAASNGTLACVEVLLAAGADINVRTNTGRTPFDMALDKNIRRVWPLLLRAGAEIPINETHPYIVGIRNAGGFKKYEQAHITRITAILAPTPRLPPEMVRKIVEFWLHAGYY